MSDNPYYDLQRRIEAARAEAEASIDPFDHMLKNALQGVADAEIHRLAREVHDATNPAPDPASFAKWSQVSEPGELDYGPFVPPEAPEERAVYLSDGRCVLVDADDPHTDEEIRQALERGES